MELLFRQGILSVFNNKLIHQRVQRSPLFSRLKSRFVAGESIGEVLTVTQELCSQGFSLSLDFLGEAVSNWNQVDEAYSVYDSLLEAIHQQKLKANVSLKLTQFGLLLDQTQCLLKVETLLQKAYECKVFIRLDMEQFEVLPSTWNVFRALFPSHPNTGVVLQSYLRRIEQDARLCVQNSYPVRLCKGAYKESPEAAYQKKSEVDQSYARCLDIFFQGLNQFHHDSRFEHRPLGIATHDETMIQTAKELAQRYGVDRSRFEFQMLYGIRRDLQHQLKEEGYGMRIYVPFGKSWYPYLTRRLAERPANLFFILKNLWR